MWIARDWVVISVSYAVECIRQNDLKCFEDKTTILSVFGDRSVFVCRLRCVDSCWMNKLWPFFSLVWHILLIRMLFAMHFLCCRDAWRRQRVQGKSKICSIATEQNLPSQYLTIFGSEFFSIFFFHFWCIGEAIKLHWHRKWHDHEHTVWQPTASLRAILVDHGIRHIRVEWNKSTAC